MWGALFFLFLSFAALTTVVAVFENILSFAMDLFGVSRKKAVAVNIVLVILLSMRPSWDLTYFPPGSPWEPAVPSWIWRIFWCPTTCFLWDPWYI